jgi:hypothetical protein
MFEDAQAYLCSAVFMIAFWIGAMVGNEALNAKTLVDLALLGFLAGGTQPASVLIARIKQAGGDGFTPTADFIRERLLDLLSRGHVELGHAGDELSATPAGRDQILRLLRLDLDPAASVLRSVCTTLKICLLDQVDDDMRADIVGTLCCSRDCRPAAAAASLPACPLMARYLAIEQRRRAEEQRFWQDTLLEEGLLDPVH